MAGLTDPVQITVHPFSQKITAGSTATVSVIAVGSSLGVIYYQWATSNPRLVGATVIDQAGQGGISSGVDSRGGTSDFRVGAQSSSLYPNIPAFLAQGGYAQPAGLITGATSSSYTTPVLQASDNGTQLRCYVVQIVTNPQSVGNLTTSQTHGVSAPFTTSMQLFSVTISGVAILQVVPSTSFVVSDNFHRADENPLSKSGAWSTVTGENPFQVVSNLCEPAVGLAHIAMLYSGVVWPPNQFSEITLQFVNGGSSNIGPTVRNSASADTFYYLACTGTVLALYAKVSGTPTLLNFSSTSVNPGDVVRLEVVGTNLTVKVNGAVIFTAVDSTIASGSAGIAATAGDPALPFGAQISNWDGGSL